MAVDDVKKDSICSTHHTNKVVLYCKTCDALICTRCISHGAAGTGLHQDHVYLDLVEAYDIGQEELEKSLAGFRDDLQAKRIERQELHTKLQKLQLALLRKKTQLNKATRSLKDCLWKKEKSFLGEVDTIIQPAIVKCEQRFKDVEFDVVSRDGLLGTSEAVLKLPTTRILSFLKSLAGIKHELNQIRKRTFTEYDEQVFNVQRLDNIHLNLHREKYLIDRAFGFPTKVAEPPRILPGWCVIGQNAATLVWKFNKDDTVKQFHVYVKPLSFADRKYTSLYERRSRAIVIKHVKKKSKSRDHNKTKDQSKRSDSHNKHDSKSYEIDSPKSESTHAETQTKTGWSSYIPWRTSTQPTAPVSASSSKKEDKNHTSDSSFEDKDGAPSWYVVEPVSYVESLSGEQQEIHDSLTKSIALTEALKKRSMGLKKKSSVSDQYLYTPVFRPKSESTALFGSKESRLNQTTIKERPSKEKLDEPEKESEKDVDTSEKTNPVNVTIETRVHSYTAIDIAKVHTAEFSKIKVSKFVPGRIHVILRDLKPGRSYVALLTAVNHCGESEATVVHFTTADKNTPSVLDLTCKPPTAIEQCKSTLKSLVNLFIIIIGMCLYGFLVFYLLSNHVTQRTCDVMVETIQEVDAVSMRTVCPHLSSDYACSDVTRPSDSWIKQAMDYIQDSDKT